jgi:RNA polymerase sigma-70 factor, ECF subfamily
MSSVLTITSMKLLKTMGTSQTTQLENKVPVSCHNGGNNMRPGTALDDKGQDLDFQRAIQEMENVLSKRGRSLHRRAYRFLGNTADAEDAVQDALLSAYKHLSEFRGESQMSTWLTAIVCNSARMRLRRRSRRRHLSLDDRIGEERQYSVSERLTYQGPSPEDACRGSELATRVAALLPHLSPSLRKAFELRDLNGLTTTEAARILGVAEGTLKAQLCRARIKLRTLMGRIPDRQRPRAGAKSNQVAPDKPLPFEVRAIRPTFVTEELTDSSPPDVIG